MVSNFVPKFSCKRGLQGAAPSDRPVPEPASPAFPVADQGLPDLAPEAVQAGSQGYGPLVGHRCGLADEHDEVAQHLCGPPALGLHLRQDADDVGNAFIGEGGPIIRPPLVVAQGGTTRGTLGAAADDLSINDPHRLLQQVLVTRPAESFKVQQRPTRVGIGAPYAGPRAHPVVHELLRGAKDAAIDMDLFQDALREVLLVAVLVQGPRPLVDVLLHPLPEADLVPNGRLLGSPGDGSTQAGNADLDAQGLHPVPTLQVRHKVVEELVQLPALRRRLQGHDGPALLHHGPNTILDRVARG